MNLQALCDRALALHREGRLGEAEPLYRQAIAGDATAAIPRHLLGILKLQQGHAAEALEWIGAALALDPGNAQMQINHGNALKLAGRRQEALDAFAKAQALNPGLAGAPYNRAILLAELGEMENALAAYDEAIAARPDFSEAMHERALLLRQQGRRDEALADMARVLDLNPRHAQAWSNQGVMLQEAQRFEEALHSFEQALALEPASAEAWHNRGNALTRLRRHDAALASFGRALAIKPHAHAQMWSSRATLLRDMNRLSDAMESLDRALAIDPHDPEALYHRARLAWMEFGDPAGARAGLETLLARHPDHPYALGEAMYLAMQAGDWTKRAQTRAAIDAGMRAGKPVIEPFIYQAVSDNTADLQRCAIQYAARRYPARPTNWPDRPAPGPRIRVGYLSGEFRQQATALLTAGLYEAHDKERFEIIAFDNGVSDHTPLRRRLEAAFGGRVDITRLSDFEVARMIADAGIDILVNLNGYFGAQRMGVFAHKPAPVQVNFLGFPGTLGADYMDYIVADRCVIPQDQEAFYSEKVVILPNSYQANDSRRLPAAALPSRAEAGLPDEGFVFCSFNQAYKLTPEMFAAWMRILDATPGSLLWLLEGGAEFQHNLRSAAQAAGVAGTRIVFAPLVAPEQHLARLALADLFVDTLPCNAHTGASDALWAGVPLVTCRGHSFAGRVAASLLSAIGLPEMIAGDIGAYEGMAIRLANDPDQLGSLRRKLAQNRPHAALFDTARYCRHLETAYARMAQRARSGQAPAGFSVSD